MSGALADGGFGCATSATGSAGFTTAGGAELLIEKGADVNAKAGFGSTPLHDAAFSDLKEVTELLIANGADVNAKAEEGWTPLHDAARGGHKEIADLLRKHGAK